jgi:hypothetical protein
VKSKNDVVANDGDRKKEQVDVAEGKCVNIAWESATERRLVRKLDLHILPILVIVFLLNILDWANMSNARLKGLEADLALTDVQYQTKISILLVGYVLCQVPFNISF